jgi:hypothetical protein
MPEVSSPVASLDVVVVVVMGASPVKPPPSAPEEQADKLKKPATTRVIGPLVGVSARDVNKLGVTRTFLRRASTERMPKLLLTGTKPVGLCVHA